MELLLWGHAQSIQFSCFPMQASISSSCGLFHTLEHLIPPSASADCPNGTITGQPTSESCNLLATPSLMEVKPSGKIPLRSLLQKVCGAFLVGQLPFALPTTHEDQGDELSIKNIWATGTEPCLSTYSLHILICLQV